jgi:hypothetical protein
MSALEAIFVGREAIMFGLVRINIVRSIRPFLIDGPVTA